MVVINLIIRILIMIMICNENDHSDAICESNTDDKCSDNGTSNNNNDNNEHSVFIHFYDLFPLLSDTVSEIQDKIGKRIYESCLG